jgi:hypothetical protein
MPATIELLSEKYKCKDRFFPSIFSNVIAKRRFLPLKQSPGSQMLLIYRETASAKSASQ